MKTKRLLLSRMWAVLLFTSFFIESQAVAGLIDYDSTTLSRLVQDAEAELRQIRVSRQKQLDELNACIQAIELFIAQHRTAPGEPSYVEALEEKIQLQHLIHQMESGIYVELLRARYTKGLELIKLLYEKVLSLDHHFAAIQTFQHVSALSNPNNYPAFQQKHDQLAERLKKKSGVQLPALLQNNPFASATFSLVAALFGEGETAQKQKDLEDVGCILDFTLRMSNDLNTIYYETEYLKQGNESLKEDIMALFADYTKPIGYYVTLDKCRKNDDWEAVAEALEKVLKDVESGNKDPNLAKTAMKHRNNLEFSIDRLLDFMDKYAAFVNQGEKYYQKFLVIVTNYSNAQICATQMPRQFVDLKNDIEVAIEKFGASYKLSELKGSKLKDLLYGLPD
ncbi:MAG: hypothetical protein L6Q97_10670 [Thermoanaerobaculia bacterium]|nr:hypothetical protein [Thermoanaerobaculia bacterium]